jgi:hypothetical protein
MKDMGTVPYFSVHYKGHRLNRKDDKHCKETGGDCFALAKKYLDFKWNNAFETSKEWKSHHYESRVCTAEDISQGLYDKGELFICPPTEKIKFQGRFGEFPGWYLGFEVSPNIDEKADQKTKNLILDQIENF